MERPETLKVYLYVLAFALIALVVTGLIRMNYEFGKQFFLEEDGIFQSYIRIKTVGYSRLEEEHMGDFVVYFSEGFMTSEIDKMYAFLPKDTEVLAIIFSDGGLSGGFFDIQDPSKKVTKKVIDEWFGESRGNSSKYQIIGVRVRASKSSLDALYLSEAWLIAPVHSEELEVILPPHYRVQ